MQTIKRGVGVVLLGSMLSSSCMTPPKLVSAPQSYIPIRHPARIWLTRPDGSRVEVQSPRVLGDSLYGRTPGGTEVWVPLAAGGQVIQARELDRTKTYLAIGAGALSLTVAGIVLAGSGSGANPTDLSRGAEDRPFKPGIVLFHIGH